MSETFRTNSVFVPGGLPELTYVRREHSLEGRVSAVTDNLCQLVAVTGPTKSGKTVLVSRVLPRTEAVWVDGGTVREEGDLWEDILEQLDGFTTTQVSAGASRDAHVEGEAGGKAGIPLLAEAKGSVRSGLSRTRHGETTEGREVSARTGAVRALRETRRPFVIDDFHYLDRSIQGLVIRALKPLVFEGVPVVVIAIPHRRYDAVKVEREIAGRLDAVHIPAWTEHELLQVPRVGFPLLGIDASQGVLDRLASEAYGSPHLIQQFCRDMAVRNGINETVDPPITVDSLDDQHFREVAESTGRVVFDKLARGPRQRSDRIQRPLRSGGEADIYEVVLAALAALKPGLDTIDYETLRGSIRQLLADNVPQAHEVTRVLEKMAEISAADEASTPVIDWEKDDQLLHITDPFFAFFLKWGDVRA